MSVLGLEPGTALLGLAVGVVSWWLLSRRSTDAATLAATYKGKVVWITGASSGIGEALALRLAAVGADLVLSARTVSRLDAVAARCIEASPKGKARVAVVPLDLSDDPQALMTLGRAVADPTNAVGLDRVDVLVNNGGVGSRSAVADTDLETDIRVMAINFGSAIALTKAVLPGMVERGGGKIVAVSSVQGKFGLPQRSSYAASKHAVMGWFDSLRAEVADDGVTVTCVCPGYVATNFSLGALKGDGSSHNAMDKTTASGMHPDAVAGRIVDAVAVGTHELIMANLQAHLAIVLRALLPDLLVWVMRRRARKERAKDSAT